MTADLLSTIVLLEPGDIPACIEQVLLSLAVQDYSPLEIVVVGDMAQISKLEDIASELPATPATTISIVPTATDLKDNNANRLNRALQVSNGKYISILQPNDIVYGFSFPRLIDQLKKSEEPIAAGGTRNAIQQNNGYIVEKSNHIRAGKDTCDIWFDEDCARHFVVDKTRLQGHLATETSLDYFETYFLLLALSLHNDINFALSAESLFERRYPVEEPPLPDTKARAYSKIISWQSAQLKELRLQVKTES